MKPEDKSRKVIDEQLRQAGWVIQDFPQRNISASPGVIVRNYPLAESKEADYVVFVDKNPIGVIEAKKLGTTLTGVHKQSAEYLKLLTQKFPDTNLALAYEATENTIQFSDTREIDYRPRELFWFHTPSEIRNILNELPLRNRLKQLPVLEGADLRTCQHEAIDQIERSLRAGNSRALVQMASGAGKTYMSVSMVYRLIKHVNVKKILFLVDRSNLGRQTIKEFEGYVPKDSEHSFSELYPTQFLNSNTLDTSSRVVVSTVQRMYSILKNSDTKLVNEEKSLFEGDNDCLDEVRYNPTIPISEFDVIIVDECHRSIYKKWRQVLEYFDAFIIGLTATPSNVTIGFFRGNLVSEYSHSQAVADQVNVGYRVFRISTRVTEEGGTLNAKEVVEVRDKITRDKWYKMLDEDLHFKNSELDSRVVVKDQIRLIIQMFKNSLQKIFPERNVVPKTLVFAKDDSHADDITKCIREVFGKGEEFCTKITYRTSNPEQAVRDFKTSSSLRIAVTVDMISTGTDVRALECILFMRDVQSKTYYEQMKGRGVRTISPTELQAITPDAKWKDHFVVVDAVGVTEHIHPYTYSLERRPSVKLTKLLELAADNTAELDDLETLASRLARLNRCLSEERKKEFSDKFEPLPSIANRVLKLIDPDEINTLAQKKFNTDMPSADQIKQIVKENSHKACEIFHNHKLREKILAVCKVEQVIDSITGDTPITSTFSVNREKEIIKKFENYVKNDTEVIKWTMYFSKSYKKRGNVFDTIRNLHERLKLKPYELDVAQVWNAYCGLKKTNTRYVNGSVTDIISLIRYVVEPDTPLEPFEITVNRKFKQWLDKSKDNFSEEQIEWLNMIKDHIIGTGEITKEDMDVGIFYQYGGQSKFELLFQDQNILEELTEELLFI